MTKKYEDDIAQSELEKLGIKAKKPKLVYPDTSYSSTNSDIDYENGSLFDFDDDVPTWQSTLADDSCDTQRDEKSVDDNEIHGEFPEIPDFLRKTPKEEKFVEEIPEGQLRKIVDQLSRILGDELEEYQLIYKSGKASQRLKKILSAYIRTQVLYMDGDTATYKKVKVVK